MIKIDNKTIASVYSGEKVIEKIYKGTLKVYEGWKNLISSGVPPLKLLNCKGVDLVDYKIYGNVESVGERTKNLLNSNTREYTNVGGIKVTYNEDGSIHYEGTSTMSLSLYLTRKSFVLPAGTYTVNKINSSCRIYLLPGYKNGTFTITEDTTFNSAYLNVPTGTTLDDTLYPQLEEGRAETEYEPYGYKIPIKASNGTEEITTNIYLKEPLAINDYIHYKKQELSKNGVPTTIELPNIPTFKGTTILSVDTTIQPSNMEVVYKGKR